MSVSTYINRVKFNDGEGLSYSDLNDLQQYMRATLLDHVIGGVAGDYATDYYPPASYLWVPNGMHAVPTCVSAGVLTSKAGLVMQWRSAGASDGLTPKMLCYWLEDDDLQTTLNAPDATNPRWDGIFVKLEDSEAADSQDRDLEDAITGVVTTQSVTKKYRTKLTKSYVAGTAAATNISFPATPSGYVPWCYVCVPPGAATLFGNGHFALVTMPLRRGAVDLFPKDMSDGGGATALQWNSKGSAAYLSDANAKGNWIIPIGSDCRVTGVDIWGYTASGTYTVTPKRFSTPSAADAVWTAGDIGTRSETYPEVFSSSTDGATLHDYRTLLNSTGVGNGMPLWGGGYGDGPGTNGHYAIKTGLQLVASNAAYIYAARVYYCY